MTTRVTKAKELLQEGKSLYKKPDEENQIITIYGGQETKKNSDTTLDPDWRHYLESMSPRPSPRSLPDLLSSILREDSMIASLNGITVHMFARKIPISTFKDDAFTFDIGKNRYIVNVFTDSSIAGCIRCITMKEKKWFGYKEINTIGYQHLQSVGLLESLEQIVRPEYIRRKTFGYILHQELDRYQRRR